LVGKILRTAHVHNIETRHKRQKAASYFEGAGSQGSRDFGEIMDWWLAGK
jgi:hypothetical protein